MPLFINREHRIFFAHVPKAGGTSFEDYLLKRFGSMTVADLNVVEGQPKRGLITPSSHFSAQDLREFIPADMDLLLAVVREPIDRLFSEYRYQTNVSWMSRLSFSTWLRVVVTATRIEPRLYENHIRPQDEMIPEGFEIFRLEDGMEQVATRVDAVMGPSPDGVTVEHLNKRPRAPIALSREDATLVLDFYAADYARFGYAKPDLSTLPSDPWAAVRSALAAPLARALVFRQRWKWAR